MSRRNRKKSEIRIVKNKRNRRPLSRKARLRRQRIYRRRRIMVLLIFLLILVLPSKLIISKLTSYSVKGYPSFRDEVLEGITQNIFVSDTDGRSLTSAEKLADFDKVYENIARNYPVTRENHERFSAYMKSKDSFTKRIKNSKTDQDFFDLLDENISQLQDNYSFVLGKDSYTSLFNYYRNKKNSPKAKILGNDQAVDRYGRMINRERVKKEMTINSSSANTLIVRLPDFSINKLNDDINKISSELDKGNISSIVFDLSDNTSIDHAYVNEFISYFLTKDYDKKSLYFYRGWLFEQSLDEIKDNKDSLYKTNKVKNLARKYKDKVDKFDVKNFQYYDQVELSIKRKNNFRKRNLYILTNENTSNEAIRFASILKSQGAFTIKNGLDSSKSKVDKVKEMPADFIVLDHSGLVVSLLSSVSVDEDKYLDYDHRINSENPDKEILKLIK
ncbi:peptidase S41 [uncultured Anaerococcus sp.]|uniref:peptidase S41 n=1 Tax=uncultured Anaerococcus sp. TaxID=293428 RepID=UPI00288BCCD5|nr:peptidase S41 [uncultured Anaerococcus sp.]